MAAKIPTSMKALVKESEGVSYAYKDVPVPAPQGDELLIKVNKVSLCGSDIMLYQWGEVAKTIATIPFTPGHEAVGEIVALGAGVPDGFKIGQRVCVENHYYCGDCYQCNNDLRHICQRLNQFGHGRGTIYGGCSEYSIVPARYAYVLKTDIDDARASILESCGVSHQAVSAIDPKGDNILIQGCGPIGLFAIAIARAKGATKVMACDVVDSRLEIAKQLGADVVINCQKENLKEAILRETNGDGVGRLVEATGSAPMVSNSFSLLRKGGHICLVGLPKAPIHIENPLPNLVFRSITLKSVHGRRIFEDWEQTEKLMVENRINTEPIITHDIPLSKYEEAFSLLLSGNCCKIVMTPGK